MNNQEKVAKILMQHWHGLDVPDDEAECCAQALADAGLLAPDLPEPKTYGGGAIEWATIDGCVNVEKGLITVFHDERTEGATPRQLELLCVDPGEIIITSPEAAVQMGYLLIAAANHASNLESVARALTDLLEGDTE